MQNQNFVFISFLVSIDDIKLDVGRPQLPKPTVPSPVTLAPTPSDPTKFQEMPEDAGKKEMTQQISMLLPCSYLVSL